MAGSLAVGTVRIIRVQLQRAASDTPESRTATVSARRLESEIAQSRSRVAHRAPAFSTVEHDTPRSTAPRANTAPGIPISRNFDDRRRSHRVTAERFLRRDSKNN